MVLLMYVDNIFVSIYCEKKTKTHKTKVFYCMAHMSGSKMIASFATKVERKTLIYCSKLLRYAKDVSAKRHLT